MLQIENKIFTLEEKIIHHLILQTTTIEDYGLLHGKMGISIAFFECGKYWKNVVYSDFANELNDNFLDRIKELIIYDFEKGLSGIGWGIEYMKQRFPLYNRNHNEICKYIDQKIIAIDIRRTKNVSLNTGLEGLLHYILIRLKSFEEQKDFKPFDDVYLKDTYDGLQLLSKTEMPSRLYDLIQIFVSYIDAGVMLYKPNICSFINHQEISSDEDLLSAKLGLANGLAGRLIESVLYSENKITDYNEEEYIYSE